jgi:hypothetical protein
MPEDHQKTTFATPKHEDMPAERIKPQHLLNLPREAVHAAPHVGVAGGEPEPTA